MQTYEITHYELKILLSSVRNFQKKKKTEGMYLTEINANKNCPTSLD